MKKITVDTMDDKSAKNSITVEKKTEIGYIFILYTDFYFFFIFYSFILANFAL